MTGLAEPSARDRERCKTRGRAGQRGESLAGIRDAVDEVGDAREDARRAPVGGEAPEERRGAVIHRCVAGEALRGADVEFIPGVDEAGGVIGGADVEGLAALIYENGATYRYRYGGATVEVRVQYLACAPHIITSQQFDSLCDRLHALKVQGGNYTYARP